MVGKQVLAFAVVAVVGFVGFGCSKSGSGTTGGGGTPGPALTLSSPSFTLKPGEEMFKCWYTTIATTSDLQAVRMHSTMTPGSHHFIVYTTTNPLRPDGTFEDCGDNQGGPTLQDTPVWLYATQDPDAELVMPAGTALPLKANQPLYFNMHYINATMADMTVNVSWDVESESGTFQKVAAFVTYNTQISIPPGGQQTVSGDCDVPAGAQFFTMSTHSHKRTVEDIAGKSVGGVMSQTLVDTTDWSHATISRWAAPSFLTFAPGEQLHYQCSYMNDTTSTITVGESAEKNEMCMAVGYYFPAAGDTFCLNSAIFSF
jgi:Copper type II ascorbate-dependent monooxygenase, C-terminal domain